ncbi:MAG TPA: glycosyltransferase family 9 protein [Ignavibacteriaceae bacterium]|nr:glycosyltransferase family 9 protein [Ignavibacteriaceae bacterium]
MNLKSKIYIDKILGIPSVFFLDKFSLFLQKFRTNKIPANLKVKRIAVCKLMGMGSIIQSTPLLMSLRKSFPDAEIIFITSPNNYSLLQTFSFIDKIKIINDKSAGSLIFTFLKTFLAQWFKRTDVFVDLEIYSYLAKILTLLSFPKYKLGFYKKESAVKLGIYTKMIYFNTKAPVFKMYLQAAYILHSKKITEELYDWKPVLKYFDSSYLVKSFVHRDPEKDYIVINPNASDLRIERRWDSENYTQLIDKILCEHPGKKIILTGSREEKTYVQKIYSEINEKHKDKVLNSAGELSLSELVALINGCSLMITNDSGPMHIAFGLKKKTVALFGPCSPEEYNTYRNVYFVYKNIYCSPCVHYFSISPCRGDNQCMKLIGVEEVNEAVNKILNNEFIWKSYSGNGIIYKSLTEGAPFGISERKFTLR